MWYSFVGRHDDATTMQSADQVSLFLENSHYVKWSGESNIQSGHGVFTPIANIIL